MFFLVPRVALEVRDNKDSNAQFWMIKLPYLKKVSLVNINFISWSLDFQWFGFCSMVTAGSYTGSYFLGETWQWWGWAP